MKNNKKYLITYAFIDSQNLNLGTSKDLKNSKGRTIYNGWHLDFKKFRIYLRDKFRVSRAFLFIGRIKENERMYSQLKSFGYDIVFKPTTKDSLGKPKGNIDAELVLHSAAIEYPRYNKAVIVSGDGDFYCLYEYLISKGKLLKIIIPNKKSMSTLLNKFDSYKNFLIDDREILEYKKMGGVHSSNT